MSFIPERMARGPCTSPKDSPSPCHAACPSAGREASFLRYNWRSIKKDSSWKT